MVCCLTNVACGLGITQIAGNIFYDENLIGDRCVLLQRNKVGDRYEELRLRNAYKGMFQKDEKPQYKTPNVRTYLTTEICPQIIRYDGPVISSPQPLDLALMD